MKLDGYTTLFAERILAALEKGTAPWQRPWQPGTGAGNPRNGTTDRPYHGTNSVLLRVTALLMGYDDPRWAGFNQIRHAGGMVRKGEKGTPVLVWRVPERQREDEDGEDDQEPPRMYAAFHHVFNVAQTEGWDLPTSEPRTPAWTPRDIVAQVAADADITIRHADQSQAYYSPEADVIVMPERAQFPERCGYEHTLLHELGHATMHQSRLDRKEAREERDTEGYAIEELRAEIGAMLAGEQLDVGYAPRHGHAYVASWIRALKNDPDQVRRATADAGRIAAWLTRNVTTVDDAQASRQPAAA